MKRACVAVLIVSLAAVAVVIVRASLHSAQLQQQLNAARAEILEADETRHAEAVETLLTIQRRIERNESTLNQTDKDQLHIALIAFESRIKELRALRGSNDELIQAHAHLGDVAWVLRDFGRCREALEAAMSEIEQTADNDRSQTVNPVSLDVRNSLGCLAAWTGQFEEAERLLKHNQELLDKELLSLLPQPGIRWMQARGRLNLGVVAILLGRDGFNDLRLGVELATQLLPDSTKLVDSNDLYLSEVVIDASYYAGKSALTVAKLNDAREMWTRAHDAIWRLRTQSRNYKLHTDQNTRVAGYRSGIEDIKADLQTLAGMMDTASPPSIANHSHWRWAGLNDGRSLSLVPFDLTIRGRLAAEFERQDAILFVWPDLAFGRETLLAAVKAAQATTQLIVGVRDGSAQRDFEDGLTESDIPSDRIKVIPLPVDTIWVRDFGPLTVLQPDGTPTLANPLYWHDNAQGRFHEDALPLILKGSLREPVCRLPILFEGGALLTNGDGLCLVPSRNLTRNQKIGMSEEIVTSTIKRITGATKVIYLEPLSGEPTQHVDWFATFTSVDTVVIGHYTGMDPENAAILDRNAELLRDVETSRGPLKVVRIPQPPRERDFFGGSYTNVVYANGTLLVPTWRSAPRKMEKEVLDTYQRLLPDWTIVPIECSELGRRAGALRCATMNLFRVRDGAIVRSSIE